MTWVLIDRDYNFIKLFCIGPLYLLFAVFDYFYFRMYPAQENIFVEDAIARRKEKQVFDKMNSRLKMNESVSGRNKRLSVFDLNRQNSHQLKVSFLMPFGDAKIFQLIFSCGLRMAASSLGVQASRLFTELNKRSHDGKTSNELID